MGYYSNFLVNIRKKDGSAITNESADALVREIENYGYKPDDVNEWNDNKTICLFFNEIKWYDCAENLADLTRRHPDIKVNLEREGEDHDDTEQLIFLDGKAYDASPFEINLPEPCSGRMLLAVFDPDSGRLEFRQVADEPRPAVQLKNGKTEMVVRELYSEENQRKVIAHDMDINK